MSEPNEEKPSSIGLWRGARYPFWGLRFIYVEHRELARYWIWPILITALMAGAAIALVWTQHDALLGRLWAPPEAQGFLGWLAHAAYVVVDFLLAVVLGGVSDVDADLIGNHHAAPYNDAHSEEDERLLCGRAGPAFSFGRLFADALRTVRLEALKLGVYAGIMLPLFVVSLMVPGVGQVAYGAFGFAFTSLYFAVDYVDWPASRRGRGVRERLALFRLHKGAMFGFGVGVWVFLWVPFLNLFFMPAAVAGGTKLYLDIDREGDEPTEA
jgi:CysZ protein